MARSSSSSSGGGGGREKAVRGVSISGGSSSPSKKAKGRRITSWYRRPSKIFPPSVPSARRSSDEAACRRRIAKGGKDVSVIGLDDQTLPTDEEARPADKRSDLKLLTTKPLVGTLVKVPTATIRVPSKKMGGGVLPAPFLLSALTADAGDAVDDERTCKEGCGDGDGIDGGGDEIPDEGSKHIASDRDLGANVIVIEEGAKSDQHDDVEDNDSITSEAILDDPVVMSTTYATTLLPLARSTTPKSPRSAAAPDGHDDDDRNGDVNDDDDNDRRVKVGGRMIADENDEQLGHAKDADEKNDGANGAGNEVGNVEPQSFANGDENIEGSDETMEECNGLARSGIPTTTVSSPVSPPEEEVEIRSHPSAGGPSVGGHFPKKGAERSTSAANTLSSSSSSPLSPSSAPASPPNRSSVMDQINALIRYQVDVETSRLREECDDRTRENMAIMSLLDKKRREFADLKSRLVKVEKDLQSEKERGLTAMKRWKADADKARKERDEAQREVEELRRGMDVFEDRARKCASSRAEEAEGQARRAKEELEDVRKCLEKIKSERDTAEEVVRRMRTDVEKANVPAEATREEGDKAQFSAQVEGGGQKEGAGRYADLEEELREVVENYGRKEAELLSTRAELELARKEASARREELWALRRKQKKYEKMTVEWFRQFCDPNYRGSGGWSPSQKMGTSPPPRPPVLADALNDKLGNGDGSQSVQVATGKDIACKDFPSKGESARSRSSCSPRLMSERGDGSLHPTNGRESVVMASTSTEQAHRNKEVATTDAGTNVRCDSSASSDDEMSDSSSPQLSGWRFRVRLETQRTNEQLASNRVANSFVEREQEEDQNDDEDVILPETLPLDDEYVSGDDVIVPETAPSIIPTTLSEPLSPAPYRVRVRDDSKLNISREGRLGFRSFSQRSGSEGRNEPQRRKSGGMGGIRSIVASAAVASSSRHRNSSHVSSKSAAGLRLAHGHRLSGGADQIEFAYDKAKEKDEFSSSKDFCGSIDFGVEACDRKEKVDESFSGDRQNKDSIGAHDDGEEDDHSDFASTVVGKSNATNHARTKGSRNLRPDESTGTDPATNPIARTLNTKVLALSQPSKLQNDQFQRNGGFIENSYGGKKRQHSVAAQDPPHASEKIDRTTDTEGDDPGYKYVEVERRRDKRRAMPAHKCEECAPFINAVCGDGGFDLKEILCDCSRHRARHGRNPTPEDFWDLSFVDERKGDQNASK